MQIVIEISEKIYEARRDWVANPKRTVDDVDIAIANGIVLTKGHGRLKDIDEIDWYGCTTEYDCPYKNRDCKDCDRAECSKTQVDSIPTIIPADKEDAE